jgi:hypothetical protein
MRLTGERQLGYLYNPSNVMPGLAPGFPRFAGSSASNTWMTGARPAMTEIVVPAKKSAW